MFDQYFNTSMVKISLKTKTPHLLRPLPNLAPKPISALMPRLASLKSQNIFSAPGISAMPSLVGCRNVDSASPWTKWPPFKQTTFSIALSWMKMIELRFKFHWNMFPGVQLTIRQHWSGNGLAPAPSHYLTNDGPFHWRVYAALGGDEWIVLVKN